MIDPKNRDHVERAEEYAPKRLARADVAKFRALYEKAYAVSDVGREGYKTSAAIFLERGRAARTIGRLGNTRPCCRVTLAWSQTKKHGEWGLDLSVTAVSVTKRDTPPAGRTRTRRTSDGRWISELTIGKHRFRKSSTQTQFCREVSHLVRLGLGWSKKWSKI